MAQQTDFSGKIRKYGCLFFCLMHVAEKASGKQIRKEDVLTLYKGLQEKEIMNDECFVYNHTKVINEALAILPAPGIHVKYSGAQYFDHPEKSWGKKEGDYVILQAKTEYVPGHFLMVDYNPYFPPSNILSIRSVRYYDLDAK